MPTRVDHSRFEIAQNRKPEKQILAEVKQLAKWLNATKPLEVRGVDSLIQEQTIKKEGQEWQQKKVKVNAKTPVLYQRYEAEYDGSYPVQRDKLRS